MLKVLTIGPYPNLDGATVGPPLLMHHLGEGIRECGDVELTHVFFAPHGHNAVPKNERQLCINDPPMLSTLFSSRSHKARVQEFIRAFEPDVIDLHSPHKSALLEGLDIPRLVTIHGLLPELLKHSLIPRRKMLIAPFYLRAWERGIRDSNAAICLSAHDASYISDRYQTETHVMGVPRSREFFITKTPNHTFTALAIGALTPRKGYEDLLKVAALLRSRIPGFKLRIAGGVSRKEDDAYRKKLERQIVSLVLRDCVTLLGQLPHLSLVDELHRSSVLLHLARQETLPGAVVEALATGTPVIAYDIPSAREAVRNEETGFLLPLGDIAGVAQKTEMLLKSPGMRGRIEQAAHHYALAKFSAHGVALQYLRIVNRTKEAARASFILASKKQKPPTSEDIEGFRKGVTLLDY